jgi:hypothetical protein
MSFLSQPISLIPSGPQRMIGTIQVNVVLNENTTDTLSVTKQPVQQGASITDHAYSEPTVFSHTIYFSANLNLSLPKLYQQLLTLQQSRTPFSIVTPKRTYTNMLMTTLSQQTDGKTENTLAITASYQQIILVPIGILQVARSNQGNPGTTGQTVPSGKKSAAATAVSGVKGALSGLGIGGG